MKKPRCRKIQISVLREKRGMKGLKKDMNTNTNPHEVDDDNESLHHLHSDLSSLLHQIDELVVQASNLKNLSEDGRKEFHSFASFLSNMLSSLKPWLPRFQTLLHSETPLESDFCDSPVPEETTTLVSPSPLVSWRANCTIERGKQMFMLTPLPLSSKLHHTPSNSNFKRLPLRSITNQDPNLVSSPPKFSERDGSMLVMMTPCLKMSPPKSCVLLEPISEVGHLVHGKKVHKSTPYPLGIQYSDSDSDASESPENDVSRSLAFKYPELLGIQQISKCGTGRKKTVDASPNWLTSPPKSCVLLEPSDEESLELDKPDNDSHKQITESIVNQQVSKLKDDVSKEHNHDQARKSLNKDNDVGKLSHIESTPMWKEPESSFRTGKCPGENTLKKELWTKFEAASTCEFHPKLPTIPKNSQKGFLDLLEEASSNE